MCAALLLIYTTAALGQTPASPPLTAQESMELLHVRPGYRVELVASEPLVVDPVAVDWGPDGSLWVVEMADYPLGMDGAGQPGGRIRQLTDTDGDGRYDASQLFVDGIPFPTGILSWGNGVLVTAAPELFYAEDTDADGRADKKQVLFSGFLEGNQQLRVNGLRWGLDNWVHCASGSHHAGYGEDRQIKAHLWNRTVPVGSRDFRFRPDTGEIDPQSGPSQYGRNRDDWGNWFGVQNSHPLWHYVLDDHHIRRNPHYAAPDPRKQVVVPSNPPVYPAKPPQKRFHSFDQSGHFTSACSPIIYRDELLFERGAAQHAFTCEPFHNLVQHNVLVEDGVSFRAYRDPAEGERDFFASADRWCRPVMARTGPDGALWIVDMYRYMIEHPEWLPEEGQDELRPFYRSGDDRGRIYRIVPTDNTAGAVNSLAEMSGVELVATLESPNGWLRDMAHRQLVQNSSDRAPNYRTSRVLPDAAAVPGKLEAMVNAGTSPLARLHALCVLDGLGKLRGETVVNALGDAHPGVRRHAVRLAQRAGVGIASLANLANDTDPKVRIELASALGDFQSSKAADVMLRVAQNSKNDTYIVAALSTSVRDWNLNRLVERAVVEAGSGDEFVSAVFSQAAAFGDRRTVAQALEHACTAAAKDIWWLNVLSRILDGVERRQWPGDGWHSANLTDAIVEARKIATDGQSTSARRAIAVRLLYRENTFKDDDLSLLAGLLTPQTPPEVQASIIEHLGSRPDREVAEALLSSWKSQTPALRAQILSTVATRQTWTKTLLSHLQSGHIGAGEIDARTRRRLLAVIGTVHRPELEQALEGSGSLDRRQVVADLRRVLDLTGDRTRGEVVFRKKCSSCHRHSEVGHQVGPDLIALTDKSGESLLNSLLDPSRAVEAKYLEYVAVSEDGRTLTGILETETGAGITLLGNEGKRVSLLRNQIDILQSTGKSLMPDGLEKDLTPQDLADVIKFVQTMRTPAGR